MVVAPLLEIAILAALLVCNIAVARAAMIHWRGSVRMVHRGMRAQALLPKSSFRMYASTTMRPPGQQQQQQQQQQSLSTLNPATYPLSSPPATSPTSPYQSATTSSTAATNGGGAGSVVGGRELPKFSDQITIVRDRTRAREIVKILESAAYADVVWACDTEVADIDLDLVGPVGNGKVTCVSIFGGPSVDFGDGPGTALWIENIGEAAEVLQEFKGWFESPQHKKVWHNYGFDRHVINNEGIDIQGFFGDTMHMARLNDTSREKVFGSGKGYSLESLSDDFVDDVRLKKISMKELFGVARLKKDGTEGKVKELPPIRELQMHPQHRPLWIEYSAKDAVATWWVHHELEKALRKQDWLVGGRKIGNMLQFYTTYLRDFGDLLTVMERNGIKVDTDVHLAQAEVAARAERDKMERIFLDWAAQHTENAQYINTGSSAQLGQFLFGHIKQVNGMAQDLGPRTFKLDKAETEIVAEAKRAIEANPYVNHKAADLKALLKERGLKTAGKKVELLQRLLDHDAGGPVAFEGMSEASLRDMCAARGLEAEGTQAELAERLQTDSAWMQQLVTERDKAADAALLEAKPKKYREISITSVGLKPLEWTPAGTPQVSAAVLRKLAGSNVFGDEKDFVKGRAYEHFAVKGPEEGRRACQAIGALATIGQIDATITNFLVPLQTLVDKKKRIHCSLNLNTETGRLSSRRPNLQNQPALEKDQYKIRDAFVAEPGNTLIVADYGQLELRLMAHMTRCASMIDAFAGGGCFHSRTAVGMYDYVKEAVDTGKVLLEWDYSKGQPTVPLVKDTYASERRKAKTLNFSIAYGKTVHGLAQDWGISTDEASETLEAWYRDRPEVKEWQDKTRAMARKEGYVRTIMGRYRLLPDAQGPRGPAQGHALRAAINTPIQGSAADVVMMAMLRLWRSETLQRLGWKLLLQIHDEVILEGPKESHKEALEEVRACMENPFDGHGLEPLSVHLDVDAKSADTWYKAK